VSICAVALREKSKDTTEPRPTQSSCGVRALLRPPARSGKQSRPPRSAKVLAPNRRARSRFRILIR
jgi:hypothetical protein